MKGQKKKMGNEETETEEGNKETETETGTMRKKQKEIVE